MTTACGSTISSPDTQKTLSFEEAPFGEYLNILRKEGFTEDADNIEESFKSIFVDLQYTEEQLYSLSFNKAKQVVEIYLNELNNQLQVAATQQPQTPLSISGKMLAGKGAEKFSEEDLIRLAQKQQNLREEEKIRLQMG